MLLFRLIPAACLLTAVSCSSAPKMARITTPRAPVARPSGVKEAMERHVRVAHEVRNAIDAGEGDFEARQLRERLLASPGDLDARLRLASRYEELAMPELAIEHYRLAAERFPGDVAPQIRLARAMHKRGRAAEAAAALEAYLAAYPEAPAEAHSWAGILRDALGHHAVAENHHREALERSGAAGYLRNNLGQNLAMQDRQAEAASEFRAALDLEPTNPVARNNLAIALSSDPAAAARVLEDGGTNDPATVHSNLAAVLIEQGRYGEARKELNLALGYKPDHMAALANLALVSDLDGKPARMLPPEAGASAVAAAGRPGMFGRIGRVFAKIFTTSEARHPEQSASAGATPVGKARKPSD